MKGDKRARPVEQTDAAHLAQLAARLRAARAERGMTRSALAEASGVSLRFLAQLEAGRANPSLIVMRRVATALGMPLGSLISDAAPRPVDQALLLQVLNRLSADQLAAARALIVDRFGRAPRPERQPITLLGLRGAGKSTLGRRLAKHLHARFVELDREVERAYGATLGEILQLHGQPGYRRYERECLLAALDKHGPCVIEAGGGLATDPEALELVLERTQAVWIRTSPEEHMRRVVAQGDLRPMAKSKEAMSDLRAILKAREPYYRQAPLQLNTSRKTVDESFTDLLALLERA
jgi:XRE family transcriptional regulator, aerobic/anaerobic benzoate catabolism transcriptional regulator